ncbi:MAG: glycosyl transferase group 1, partial [Verrucomicrobia bacterium]|nr:glycosyl transferase group 1 [Verrucomicrobiota bacterium]
MPEIKPSRTRIIFVNRFYWPEEPATAQLLTDLAEAMASAGHRVTVIASHSRRRGVVRAEVRHGVEIRRVRGTRWASGGGLGKAVDFLTFYLGACLMLLFTARKGDAVIALTDPPLIGVGAWIAARMRGARVFHWVQDIYPEIAMELTGHRWLAVARPLRNLAWRHADGCVVLGADMGAVLVQAGVPPEKITLSPNWA